MLDSSAIRHAHSDIAESILEVALENAVDLSEKEFISLVFEGKVVAMVSAIKWDSHDGGVSLYIYHTVGATIVPTGHRFTSELLIP